MRPEEKSMDIQEALDTIQNSIKYVIEADPKLGPFELAETIWEAFGDTDVGDDAQDELAKTIVTQSGLSDMIADLRDALEEISDGHRNANTVLEDLEDY